MNLYLDASAVLAVLFRESGADEAAARLNAAGRRYSSRLLFVEVERAFCRLALKAPQRRADLTRIRRDWAALSPTIDLLEMTRAICDSAGRVAPAASLRTLDAIHLATFLEVRAMDPYVRLLALDRRLIEAVEQA
ncbi:MAG: type II toxin-antitoxin system VapC family toxin [Phycisphaerae bacterium]|nr:type II toxin-antitoxin system VapC family toxin [Phycisphaerae bacterium]NUQ46151.1 type II toxin-antitoxin system VapC family toxin [Phycisphaerae bacterium]